MKLVFKPKKIKIYEKELIEPKINKILSDFDDNLTLLIHEFINITNEKKGLLLRIKRDQEFGNNEGYKLSITKEEITIISKTSQGAFYAIVMLEDILKNKKISLLEIEDYPDLGIRGVMIDISRSKVPKLETLKEMVKMFAKLRYNHLELYVEGFSFEYQNFKELLIDKNYITLNDYLELEKFANKYYIDFVPNQNGFGHMADWLEVDKYKHLAECEDGFYIWGSHRAPTTLNPLDNESLKLVMTMYKDMLPYTSSKYFNMNFDEPYELGHGKSKIVADATSIEDVYINYFNKLADIVRSYNKIPMLWGDVLVKHPDKISKLPKDVIFIDWGYNKDYPFFEHAQMLERSGVKYMLAPGTVTWSSITGRQIDMITTITNSINAAKKHNALGVLITDWGDCGHLQYLPVSYHGFVLGGLLSWNLDSNLDSIDTYLKSIFKDDNLCKATLNLSTYHLLEGEYRDYGSRLFNAILWAEHSRNQKEQMEFFKTRMQANLLDEIAIKLLNDLFDKTEKLLLKTNDTIESSEIKNSLKILKTLLQINQKLKDVFEGKIVEFENEIKQLEEYLTEHKRLWFIRNIEFGYSKSANRINWLIEMLRKMSRKENL